MRSVGATPNDLEALYREKFPSFARVATAICRDPEAGRDAVQSGFVAAVKSRHTFRGDGSLEGWVWQIVVNEARRAAGRGIDSPLDGIDEVTAANGDADDDPLGVRRWIAALPPREREIVFLRYFADLDYATIASVLGIERGTVSATLNAAHHRLRQRLEATAK